MDFDEKPIIYIVTTNENAYSRIADAARAIGYDVHFPLVDGCVDLFTIETDLTAAVLVDIDMGTISGVGLLQDIKEAQDKAGIGYGNRPPIVAVSDDENLIDSAKQAGAEAFTPKFKGDEAIFATLLAVDEGTEGASIQSVFDTYFPSSDHE